ncbi:acyl carrier protein [Puniceicoccales bacterium CK1056]|uniref:Acyl carrier protein n=1 Tax=Oceanipulchritudo coccoides TaxID=2706888 RepID=A0A6B2LYY7_9BACT|nr:acyl carrier protein [Oceanipulchritudo coccoides]NDV61643.1 acyl carrier protein [Oceanipulchritudo coccoides]
MSVLQSISEHFAENGLDLDPEEDLFSSGQVDSVSMMEAIAFIENKFQVTVPHDELIPDNFRSLQIIAGYIEGKLKHP